LGVRNKSLEEILAFNAQSIELDEKNDNKKKKYRACTRPATTKLTLKLNGQKDSFQNFEEAYFPQERIGMNRRVHMIECQTWTHVMSVSLRGLFFLHSFLVSKRI